MKKLTMRILVLLVLTSIVASALPLFANASEAQNTLEYVIEDENYTVIFENELSQERMELIAKRLLGIEVETVAPYGLLCTLFGHKYDDGTLVEAITHNARTSAPRCLSEYYLVKVCSRCEDIDSTLISQTYIYCH